jgi:hypothetical protein
MRRIASLGPRSTRGALAVLAALAAAPSIGAGADPSATKTLSEIVRLGPHWYGPAMTMDDLRGRVVLIEDWGRN